MALDGIVLSAIIHELNTLLVGGRIDKITQPEKDEIIIYIRSNKTAYKLLLCAQATYPRIHLTQLNKVSPMTAPGFLMLLRKYLNNGRIIKFEQHGLERIAKIYIEHLNELGDICQKVLIIEIMGRHSNIILCDLEGNIIDSIKHVNHSMSSVREVFPGLPYILPPSQDKIDPLTISTFDMFASNLRKPLAIQTALYHTFTGFSPQFTESLCYMANVDSQISANEIDDNNLMSIYNSFTKYIDKIKKCDYQPTLYLDDDKQHHEFYAFNLKGFEHLISVPYDSISLLLDEFYEERANRGRVLQKSADIRKLIQNNIERCSKKLDLQIRQLEDTKDLDKFRIKGELIHSNLYQIHLGDSKAEVWNYYTNEMETISLDPTLTPSQNANRYFDKYNKKKRTFAAVSEQLEETKRELNQLESIQFSLELATNEQDLLQIRNELTNLGYLKFRKSKAKKAEEKSEPLHYISSDGYHIYVGKNNFQNEEISTKVAQSNDWWFHAKNIPGSHVIVKCNNEELPDRTYEEAAALAAYYSKAKDSPKVEVDYTQKKHLKKPPGSAPGYFIYHTNYSMTVEPKENHIEKV